MKRGACILIVALYLAGCGNASKVATLESETKRLTDEIKSLSAKIELLETDQRIDRLIDGHLRSARLTPGAGGFSFIRTDFGTLAVSLENIEAYANGSRITLEFGNLLSSTILSGKATVEWGSGKVPNAKPLSRELDLANIRSGAWNKVTTVLEGMPPSDLAFVEIKGIEISRIALQRAL